MIFDCHSDILTSDNFEQNLLALNEKEDSVICAFFKGKRSFFKAKETALRFLKSKRENTFLAFEDFSYTSGEREELLSLSPLCVSLCHNQENLLASGCFTSGKIKKEGKELIKKLNNKKIALDLAHINQEGFFEGVELAERVVVTHTAFSAINAHKRNVTDEQIKLILQKKGVVGICVYSEFLTSKGKAEIRDFVAHIDYFVQKFGINGLSVGSDFFGCKNVVRGLYCYKDFFKVKNFLKKLGYKNEDVERIFYRNASDFFC